MSTNRESSRFAQLSRLSALADLAIGERRPSEAVAHLREMLRLDPQDRRTLRRLGDLHAGPLGRFREAAGYYAREARLLERDRFPQRALALWRLVLRHDPGRLEAHERLGSLYVELGRLADARQQYRRSAEQLAALGMVREAAVLRAHLATVEPPPGETAAAPPAAPAADPDDTALDFLRERLQNGRLYRRFGLLVQAREQLEQLLRVRPDHVEGLEEMVEVCRGLEEHEAAAAHFGRLTRLLRELGCNETAAAPDAEALVIDLDELPDEPSVPPPPSSEAIGLIDELRHEIDAVLGQWESRERARARALFAKLGTCDAPNKNQPVATPHSASADGRATEGTGEDVD